MGCSPLVVEPLPGLSGEGRDGRGRAGPPPGYPWSPATQGDGSAGSGLLEAPGSWQGRGRGQGQNSDRVVVDLVGPVTGQALVMFGLPDDAVHTLHAGLQPLDGAGGDGVVLVAAAGPGVNRFVITLVQSIVTETKFPRNAEDGAQGAGATDLRTGSHGSVGSVGSVDSVGSVGGLVLAVFTGVTDVTVVMCGQVRLPESLVPCPPLVSVSAL